MTLLNNVIIVYYSVSILCTCIQFLGSIFTADCTYCKSLWPKVSAK